MRPIDELLDRYLRDQLARGLTPSSARHRLKTLRGLALYVQPRTLLEARTADVEQWLDRPLAPPTRYWHLSNASAFFAWAIRVELLDIDPTKRIMRPRLPRRLPRPLTEGEVQLALTYADARMRCWVLLGARQGLRVSEIAYLERADLLTEDDPPMLLIRRGKGGHQRLIPLHPDVIRALRAYGLPQHGSVFANGVNGRPLRPDTVSKYIGRYFTTLGIEGSAHRLRHAFATAVYRESRDIRLTQSLLGHASVATTEGYAAFANDNAAAVVARLGQASDTPTRGQDLRTGTYAVHDLHDAWSD